LLAGVEERYRRPLFIAETSHYGIGRAPWLDEVTAEVAQAIRNGVPVGGVCLYPILDRFDWDTPTHWHNCGMWDFHRDGAGRYQRVLNTAYAQSLEAAQRIVS
jgi:hypothetical protein